MFFACRTYNECMLKSDEVNYMETDIDDMIFGDCDPGPSDR